jgi:putative heme-binding domain-containing protein
MFRDRRWLPFWVGLVLVTGIGLWSRARTGSRNRASESILESAMSDGTVWTLGERGGHEAVELLDRMLRLPGLDPEQRADLLVARAMASTHDTEFAREFVTSSEPALHRTAALLLGTSIAGEIGPRPSTTAGWQRVLAAGGDRRHGRRLFHSPQLGCARCHVVEGRGRPAGPELSGVGAVRDRANIIESIVEPSREVAPEHRAQEIETREGDTYTGTAVKRDEKGGVSWLLADGRRMTLPVEEVVRVTEVGMSLMPDGLAEVMAVEEFRDLVAYLEGLTRR